MGNTYKVDTEKLQDYIVQINVLKKLLRPLNKPHYSAYQCGGNAVKQINQVGTDLIDLQKAYMMLLSRTATCLSNFRKEVDANDVQARREITKR